jgi:hypothetical protein
MAKGNTKNIHKFTEDQRSRGGSEARWRERAQGKKINHGMLFGKRVEGGRVDRRKAV